MWASPGVSQGLGAAGERPTTVRAGPGEVTGAIATNACGVVRSGRLPCYLTCLPPLYNHPILLPHLPSGRLCPHADIGLHAQNDSLAAKKITEFPTLHVMTADEAQRVEVAVHPVVPTPICMPIGTHKRSKNLSASTCHPQISGLIRLS